jgi:hypothetical protein
MNQDTNVHVEYRLAKSQKSEQTTGQTATVQALLGHSSSEITREVYLHSIPADARPAVDKVEGLVIGPNVIGPKWTQVAEEPATASTLIH